jgi:hypothetical protein
LTPVFPSLTYSIINQLIRAENLEGISIFLAEDWFMDCEQPSAK